MVNILEWDYKGWKSKWNFDNETHQDDWNNTLVTIINMASNKIYRDSGEPATYVLAHISLKYLINNLTYCNSETKMLGTRYNLDYTTDLEVDTLKVYNKHNEYLIKVING